MPIDDAGEVSSYIAAMDHGLQRLRGGFPLSLRLIREIHGILLANSRGSDKHPGEFRRSQNWIGGTRPGTARFVPQPPHLVVPSLGNLETFIRDARPDIPLLVKAALVHLQFETVRPFLDGNGRLGRLPITFLLCERAVLREPLLYLSLSSSCSLATGTASKTPAAPPPPRCACIGCCNARRWSRSPAPPANWACRNPRLPACWIICGNSTSCTK